MQLCEVAMNKKPAPRKKGISVNPFDEFVKVPIDAKAKRLIEEMSDTRNKDHVADTRRRRAAMPEQKAAAGALRQYPIQFQLTNGDLTPDIDYSVPMRAISQLTLPRLKIKAAKYFLELLKNTSLNEAAAIIHTDAIVQSLRSATFVLQKVAAYKPGFAEWYKSAREAMKDVPLLKKVVDVRNQSEKEGLELDGYTIAVEFRVHLDGTIKRECRHKNFRLAGIEIGEPIEAFSEAIDRISAVVEEAHRLGFVPPRTGVTAKLELFTQQEDKSGTWSELTYMDTVDMSFEASPPTKETK